MWAKEKLDGSRGDVRWKLNKHLGGKENFRISKDE
jgi:hypothetical protein